MLVLPERLVNRKYVREVGGTRDEGRGEAKTTVNKIDQKIL